MKLKRPLLVPFTPIYWAITSVRNMLFNLGLFKSTPFNLPIIAVGNLSAGGTGKTPHTEYLVNLLQHKFKVAVLSRGYRRKTAGFVLANQPADAQQVGDELAQIKNRFPQIIVAADADRVHGVNQLIKLANPPNLVVLDDAFQHRKIEAGMYILLTTYSDLYVTDALLPAGNLRESKSGAERAHCIIVTKCPENLVPQKRTEIAHRLAPKPWQRIYFSKICYGNFVAGSGQFNADKPFVLVTGIANPDPLVSYLQKADYQFVHKSFPDHHHFSDAQIAGLLAEAERLETPQIVTTQKDFQRLPIEAFQAAKVAVAYVPITIKFLADGKEFDQQVFEFANSYNLA